ncbi:MAG TPA: serine/threonine-protein kinase [Polyangiaceae bacterium]|nr:serine/threonine-protein kinase [Polyangiaceae bacterium]
MTEDLKQGSKLGNNELMLRIGRGGMATVWVARERGRDGEEDRLVAVKAMLPELADETEFVTMFLDEVRLVRAITHPNVVRIFDVGDAEGVMWMSMEWVEGESLHTVIAEAGKRRAIPSELAVKIIADAASGLHAAHELRDEQGNLRGVVHRDVSPHNILIGTNGNVKLVDFGVAKAIGRVSEATRAGQLKGKFGYMSPEQALGKPVDRRSDIFSLGIVLFELTTSRRLFRGEHDIDTLKLVIGGPIPRPSSIDPKYPPGLERIVLKALDRSAEQRYQSAQELAEDLRAYLKSERVVVAQTALSGLMKRVLGERIEQRRKAVRGALRALASGHASPSDLLPNDLAFTPTGQEKMSGSGVSSITGVSSVSNVGSPSDSSLNLPSSPSTGGRPSSGFSSPQPQLYQRPAAGLGLGSIIGYAIGALGLLVALFVLLFMRH